jgi:hypothetical protein
VVQARSDLRRLYQILSNLLSNSVKYTDRGHVQILVRVVDSLRPAHPQMPEPDPKLSPRSAALNDNLEAYLFIDDSTPAINAGVGAAGAGAGGDASAQPSAGAATGAHRHTAPSVQVPDDSPQSALINKAEGSLVHSPQSALTPTPARPAFTSGGGWMPGAMVSTAFGAAHAGASAGASGGGGSESPLGAAARARGLAAQYASGAYHSTSASASEQAGASTGRRRVMPTPQLLPALSTYPTASASGSPAITSATTAATLTTTMATTTAGAANLPTNRGAMGVGGNNSVQPYADGVLSLSATGAGATAGSGAVPPASAAAPATARTVLEFAVIDTGLGIGRALCAQLFTPFTQGVDTKGGVGLFRKPAGSGLGLSIVRRLVALLQGTISVASLKFHGSVFSVRIPIDGVPLPPPSGAVPHPASTLTTPHLSLPVPSPSMHDHTGIGTGSGTWGSAWAPPAPGVKVYPVVGRGGTLARRSPQHFLPSALPSAATSSFSSAAQFSTAAPSSSSSASTQMQLPTNLPSYAQFQPQTQSAQSYNTPTLLFDSTHSTPLPPFPQHPLQPLSGPFPLFTSQSQAQPQPQPPTSSAVDSTLLPSTSTPASTAATGALSTTTPFDSPLIGRSAALSGGAELSRASLTGIHIDAVHSNLYTSPPSAGGKGGDSGASTPTGLGTAMRFSLQPAAVAPPPPATSSPAPSSLPSNAGQAMPRPRLKLTAVAPPPATASASTTAPATTTITTADSTITLAAPVGTSSSSVSSSASFASSADSGAGGTSMAGGGSSVNSRGPMLSASRPLSSVSGNNNDFATNTNNHSPHSALNVVIDPSAPSISGVTQVMLPGATAPSFVPQRPAPIATPTFAAAAAAPQQSPPFVAPSLQIGPSSFSSRHFKQHTAFGSGTASVAASTLGADSPKQVPSEQQTVRRRPRVLVVDDRDEVCCVLCCGTAFLFALLCVLLDLLWAVLCAFSLFFVPHFWICV